MTANKLLVLELNEFSSDLVGDAAQFLGLRNLERVLAIRKTQTYTDDTYDSDFLEPWVQWVSIHTGKPAFQHRIKHLGDVPSLDTPQVWEALSDAAVSTGVWGCMNANRGNAPRCEFFVPDPWTFSERAYPEKLNRLLDLPRYVSRNYLNLSRWRVVKDLGRFASLLAAPRVAWALLRELPSFLFNLARFRGEHFVVISFTDFLSTQLFLHYKRKFHPACSLLFLNSIAHLQHHHWRGQGIEGNPRLAYGLRYVDKLLGALLAGMEPGEHFLMFNGLSQKNTNDEPPWVLYRQRDQESFLRAAGARFARVEAHMTHDAHVIFSDAKDKLAAAALLREALVNGQPLFVVEEYDDDPLKLFYRLQFTDPVQPGVTMQLGDRSFPFFELFEAIVERTGRHIPYGTIYSDAPGVPALMYNHQLFDYLLDFFDVRPMRVAPVPAGARARGEVILDRRQPATAD